MRQRWRLDANLCGKAYHAEQSQPLADLFGKSCYNVAKNAYQRYDQTNPTQLQVLVELGQHGADQSTRQNVAQQHYGLRKRLLDQIRCSRHSDNIAEVIHEAQDAKAQQRRPVLMRRLGFVRGLLLHRCLVIVFIYVLSHFGTNNKLRSRQHGY